MSLVSIVAFPPAREQDRFMSDRTTGNADSSPGHPGPGHDSAISKPVLERLDEAERLRLISPGGLGRLVYSGRFGLAVIPVNYSCTREASCSAPRRTARPTRTSAPV